MRSSGSKAVAVLAVDSVFERLVRDLLAGASAVDPGPSAPLAQVGEGRAAQVWAAPGVTGQTASSEPAAPVRAVQEALRALAAAPVSGRAADVAALYAVAEQARGLALAALAEMAATGSHLSAGAASAATWVRDTRTVTDVSARAEVRLAEALRDDLPAVGTALREGRVTVEHARAAVAGTRGLDPAVVRDSDPAIAALLEVVDPTAARAQLRERAEAVDPELGRDAERRAHARRGFTVDEVGPSGVALGGALGLEDGHVVLLALDLAVRGDRHDGDTRSQRQRRGDVLVAWARQEIARRGGDTVREDLRSVRAQLLVTTTVAQLAAAARGLAEEVAGRCGPVDDLTSRVPAGASLGPGQLLGLDALRRLACDASVCLAVVPGEPTDDALSIDPLGLRRDPRRDDPLFVGRAARVVTAAQWRALVVRDRHCIVRGCRRRPVQCEAHHVRHWLDGGATDLPNLVLLCFQHHHEHHDRGHDLQHRDGRWITASGWGAQAPP